QAEDGIRDRTVTGVQTCALPISLYAASAVGTLPLKFSSSCFKWRTPPSMFCCGSYGSATLSWRAVEGINCISPTAPLRETACGLKFDSTFTTARTRLGSTL